MKALLTAMAVALLPAVVAGADSPPARYIDAGACPFECCTYRAWKTEVDTVAYARPDTSAKVVAVLKAGATVDAITGEVHTSPVRFIVRKPHGHLEPGDVLWVYTYLGEGHFKVWRAGRLEEEDLGFSPHGGSAGDRCENSEQCWGELETSLTFDWWVKVRTTDGVEGWSNQPDHFGNKDACG
jgi:hypothetical protein